MSTRSRHDDDFDQEIQAHLEHETAQLVQDGMDPEAARLAARRAFGNVTRARERFHESRRVLWLEQIWQDFRYALRSVRRYPVAALVAIGSLAAGIGATTVTLMVRNAVFRKAPPHYAQPEQLSRVHVGRPDSPIRAGGAVPSPLFTLWRDQLGPRIGGSAAGTPRDLRVGNRNETVVTHPVTDDLFDVLGVKPVLGTPLAEAAAARAGDAPALLSHRIWQHVFDGRPNVVGEQFWLDNQPYFVAGVMPTRFWVDDMDTPVWTRLDGAALPPELELTVVVRRPPTVTPAALESQLRAGLEQYAQQLPVTRRQVSLRASGIEGTPLGHQVALALPYILAAAVILTLLIACANVAILMIAQWTTREHEIAIRASIGASRGRIVRALLTESVTIAMAGGTLGIGAVLMLRQWVIARSGDANFHDLSIDLDVLATSAAVALLTGMVAGVGPALYETRRLQTNPLRLMAASDRVRQRWRHALVVLEITVTIALLVQTSAMINGYQRARQADLGFSTSPLLSTRIDNPAGVPIAQVLDAFRALPGVEAAAAATAVPFSARGTMERVATVPDAPAITAERAEITPDFFSVLGVPLRAGRPFAAGEPAAMRTVIVNDALAATLFADRPAVGGRILIGDAPHDIVGVAASYATNPLAQGPPAPRIFVPIPPASHTRVQILVRAAGDPAQLVEPLRRAGRQAAVGNTVVRAGTMDQVLDVIGKEILVGTAPLFPLIAIGMVLTMAGIYGVLAFAIARRSRELAVRMAMGASGRDLVRLVTRHTFRLVSLGAALGTGLTYVLARMVRAAGGAGSIFDPNWAAFAVPIVVIAAIGLVATWIPARRATAIDPVVLLREG